VSDAPSSTTCVLLARAHGAQVAGTAPVATGWVLVEQPGSWGRAALTSSGLEPALGAALGAAAGDEVRVQLVRRPGRRAAPAPARRTVVLAHAGPSPWAEQLVLDVDGLAALDPQVTRSPTPPGLGARIDGPLWLVCTHGRRDRCCATYGRPIADALAALHGDAVWEVSHVGGHRFAGNLVALPDGTVYGALQVADALGVVELHGSGRAAVAHLRGRSGLPRAGQAAEVLVRERLEVDRYAALAVERLAPPDAEGRVTVDLVVEGRARTATVRKVATGVRYLQSCDGDEPEDPGRWELVHLTP
jgi:hypothetical protein